MLFTVTIYHTKPIECSWIVHDVMVHKDSLIQNGTCFHVHNGPGAVVSVDRVGMHTFTFDLNDHSSHVVRRSRLCDARE